jgi:hypothetical protein
MTLLRRAPREVYRVYSEAEFFDGPAGTELFAPTRGSRAGERRLRRLAGAAMLAGAVGAIGGAVVLAGSRPARGSARRAGNGAAQALARARLLTRVQTQLARNPAAGGPAAAGASDVAPYPSAARRARSIARARAAHLALFAEVTSRSRIARKAPAEYVEQRERHGGDAQVGEAMLPVDTASGSPPATTVAPAEAPASAAAPDGEPGPAVAAPDGAPTSTPAIARSSSPSTTATSVPPPAPSAERAEFGFER